MSRMNVIRQKGVSLIEILITVLVLGIGLLGVASLQVSSVASNQEGFYTSQATSIAEALASRVRSARTATMVPDSNVGYSTFIGRYVVAGEINCTKVPGKMCKSYAGKATEDCSMSELAAFERWEVCNMAEATLPSGKARIINSGNRVSIIVDWDSISEKKNFGSKKVVNQNCVGVTGNADRNCVILEVVP